MDAKTQSNIPEMLDVDLLVCGSCKRSFQLNNILGFMKHKKFDCEDPGNVTDPRSKILLCHACHQKFSTPWSLLKHAQNVHFVQIYLEQSYGAETVRVREDPATSMTSDAPSLLPIHNVKNLNIQAPDKKRQSPHLVTAVKNTSESTGVHSVVAGSDIPGIVDKVVEADKKNVSHVGSPAVDETSSIAPVTCTDPQTPKRRTSAESENKEAGSSNEDQQCCDDQDCGITVMPGTHESLKKCCSAVVPKKRKRHMEIKHRSIRNSALARLRRQRANKAKSQGDIFIDLGPDGFTSQNVQQESTITNVDSTKANTSTSRLHPSAKQKSVIIQPGSTFSIPVSYAAGSVPPFIQIIGPDFHKAPSAPSQATRLTTQLPHVPLTHGKLPTQIATARKSIPTSTIVAPTQSSGTTDSQNPALPAQSNILQGIVSQLFSGNIVTPTPQTDGAPPTEDRSHSHRDADVAYGDVHAADSGSGTVSDTSDSQLVMVGYGKKRRYPTSRPYKCDQCTDAFNQRIHLKKHQSKHTGIKPFKCDQCDYATVERSHLKVHIRVHTGEKPFKCTVCEYATAQKSTLKIHLKRHHLSTTEHCFQCPHKEHGSCVTEPDQTMLPPAGISVEQLPPPNNVDQPVLPPTSTEFLVLPPVSTDVNHEAQGSMMLPPVGAHVDHIGMVLPPSSKNIDFTQIVTSETKQVESSGSVDPENSTDIK